MIRNDGDIGHCLAGHLEIGERTVAITVGKRLFRDRALHDFFCALREGHAEALTSYSSELSEVIGRDEHDELDEFGMNGVFAGRMAIHESGLAVVESVLHKAPDADLQASLRSSLTRAAEILMAN